jgi:hypothetical protein
LKTDHQCHQQTRTQFASSNDNSHWNCEKWCPHVVSNYQHYSWSHAKQKKKNKKTKQNTGRWRKRVNLFFAINISPRQTHSSFRRQVLSGRLKSQAVQISSVTIDGGCNWARNLTTCWLQRFVRKGRGINRKEKKSKPLNYVYFFSVLLYVCLIWWNTYDVQTRKMVLRRPKDCH